MRQGKTFDEFMAGRPRREKAAPEESPFGIPGVYEDDARFILAAMGRGPRVAPDEMTTPATTPENPAPATEAPEEVLKLATEKIRKPKGRRLSKAERLERRAAKLRAEIERLKRK
jgi:hypothetical protein